MIITAAQKLYRPLNSYTFWKLMTMAIWKSDKNTNTKTNTMTKTKKRTKEYCRVLYFWNPDDFSLQSMMDLSPPICRWKEIGEILESSSSKYVLFLLVCVAASVSKVSKWNIHIWNFVQTHPPTEKFYCVEVQKLPRYNLIKDNLNFSITSLLRYY